jgi:hypothetical protein
LPNGRWAISHDILWDTATRGDAPVWKAQALVDHRPIDTTLRYAPLYGGPLAADDYRAMTQIESRFEGGENATTPPDSGQLLSLVDALLAGIGRRQDIWINPALAEWLLREVLGKEKPGFRLPRSGAPHRHSPGAPHLHGGQGVSSAARRLLP